MEQNLIMKKSIKHILADLDRVGAIVRAVEQELSELGPRVHPSPKVADMKEKLGEVHARLDGMREFVLQCQLQATGEPVSEDTDVWL